MLNTLSWNDSIYLAFLIFGTITDMYPVQNKTKQKDW